MKIKDFIISYVQKNGSVRTTDVVKAMNVTRQGACKVLRELVQEGLLTKIGTTKKSWYILSADLSPAFNKKIAERPVLLDFKNDGITEDTILKAVTFEAGARKELSKNAFYIFSYAFTEMVNNVIDHSKADSIKTVFGYKKQDFYFDVIDEGIGVYESIRTKFKFDSFFESVEHLLKGKQTTDPQRHSGEGIFYTSKIADTFILESATIRLIIDNTINDVIVETIPFLKGTRVSFFLKKKSRKKIEALFREYTNDDFEFDKTKITVKFSKAKGEHFSRSQARRILFGLEEFKRIVLDFNGVAGIGQGFADEIFRVYKKKRPEVEFEIKNANNSVLFMIKRVKTVTNG